MWALSCTNTGSTYYYIDCGEGDCGVSVAVLCGFIVAAGCLCLGVLCEILTYNFKNDECDEPIEVHAVVQGIALIGDAILLTYVLFKYYTPKSITFPVPDSSVFPRFHGLFVKDRLLSFLLGLVSLGFWWSVLGYYWLADIHCETEDTFLVSVDSFAIGVEFVLVLFFLCLVYVILAIASCDEGSCRFGAISRDCFLCCCQCCFKADPEFEQQRQYAYTQARREYPEDRNTCLSMLMDIIKLCGCIRPEYTSRLPTEVDRAIAPDAGNDDQPPAQLEVSPGESGLNDIKVTVPQSDPPSS